jgi:hypothetical protein
VQDGAEPHAQSIAVHHEQLGEVWHLKNGPRGQGALERLEGPFRLRALGESVPRAGDV